MTSWIKGTAEGLALLFFIGSAFLLSHIAALSVA